MIMEQNELNSLLREADRIDRPLPIDTLVDGGIRRGRRRLRNRRLTAVGALGTTLAALGAVVAFGLPPGGTGVTIAPAAVPTSKPSPSESSKPAPKKGTFPTVAQMKSIVAADLPDGLAMKKVVPTDFRNNHNIVFELHDEHGRGWAGAGIGRESWDGWSLDNPCKPTQGCTETKVDAGVLRITRDTEKVGRGIWYWLHRTDGTVVWIGHSNAFEGSGPVTRDRHALTDRQAIKIISAPEWGKLAQALPKELPIDPNEQRLIEEKLRQTEASGKPKR
jgi:hypothetical protein